MKGCRSDVTSTVIFARWISWIGHPLVFITLSIAIIIALRAANRSGLTIWLTLLVTVILPMALLLFWGTRAGRWSDPDVSIQAERARFYPRAIPISATAVIALWALHVPAFAVRGALVILFLLIAAAVVNFGIKLSLHALFAFYSAFILFVVNPVAGAIALALALLVFWSRLYLRRHDLLEMLVGTFLGLAGGLVTAW
ncbi:MAG TPA: phosphatase PAP2 family protein [Candidatus Udaeobacter sp.]|nr:phosphatase PAP2 family protein [Candidatus Udaeobacter sp.]